MDFLKICIAFLALMAFMRIYNPRHPLQLNVYFGVPGSGKTTYAAYLVKQANKEFFLIRLCRRYPNKFTTWILNGKHWKRSIKVWSNVPIIGARMLDARRDIGHYQIEDGKMIIDEAGVEFNSRNYKNFPPEAIKFFKYHRHYGVSVDVFSQSFEDMDITLRRLAQNFYVVKKSIIPFFIVLKRIRRKVGIDDNTHQLCDHYSFGLPLLDTRRIYCPPLWKLFNSYDFDPLPEKAWQTWDGEMIPIPDPPPAPSDAPDAEGMPQYTPLRKLLRFFPRKKQP